MTASTIETNASQLLRALLADVPVGADIADGDCYQRFLTILEAFLVGVLKEVHLEWRHESLDGILPLVARKTGEGEAEIFGECILVSDQTLVALHVRLQTSLEVDEINWLEFRLGESSKNGMLRIPYDSTKSRIKQLFALSSGGVDGIDWRYQVTFGERRV